MAIASGFIGTLRRYGSRSSSNKKKLEKWLDAVIEEIADNNGGHLVGASANGASFSQIATMTNAEWASALDKALHMIECGVKTTSKSWGQIL
eukprot:COSAG01_NODE_25629_length_739_cov_0.710938_2_plen_92_part_00